MKSYRLYMFSFLFVLLTIFNGYFVYYNVKIQNQSILNTDKDTSTSNYKVNPVSIDDDTSELYKKVKDSVVTIQITDVSGRTLSIGSGSIIKNDNGTINILTNNHVVDNSSGIINVIFSNGSSVEATIIGKDNVSDLALLKAEVDFEVTPIELGDSDLLQQGESVIAIGSPLDLAFSGTVTKGIISGLNRNIESDTNGDGINDYNMQVIQTDTTINPGNSGGPLINMDGQLIGINTSKINLSGFEGMGFSIPINEALLIIEQLNENGHVDRPKLGISYSPTNMLNDYTRSELGLNDNNGLYVNEVLKGGSAEKAGLKDGDVIIKVNGSDIESISDFTSILYRSRSGDSLQLVVLRDGNELDIDVKL